jgi:hypothetical protein
MATINAPKKPAVKPSKAAKKPAAKKTRSTKGRVNPAKIGMGAIGDYVVLFDCNSEIDIKEARKLLEDFKQRLEAAKLIGFFRIPGSKSP